jgi:hypothetical protein
MAYEPIPPAEYAGKQVLISSDRILFNARTDSVFLFSDKSVGISTNGTFNVDSGEDTIINSPAIYLGLDAVEPLALGDTLVAWLEELTDALVKHNHIHTHGPTTGLHQGLPEFNSLKSKAKNILSAQNYTL